MDKDKTALENFLGEIGNNEEVNPFDQEAENPFNEVVENEPDKPIEDDKPLPFNKDPKVQKYLDKREKEIEARILASVKPIETKVPTVSTDDDFYVELIGNDTPEKLAMIKKYKAREQEIIAQAEERALSRTQEREEEALRADQDAEQELENAFDFIEENYEVDITSNSPLARKTRQEFVSFVEKIAPKDRQGDIIDYPDMPSAWEAFSELKKATTQPSRAKELANRGMARSAETPSTPQKRVTFSDADDYIASLPK